MATLRLSNFYEQDYYTSTVSFLVIFLFALSFLLVWGLPDINQSTVSLFLENTKKELTIERIR